MATKFFNCNIDIDGKNVLKSIIFKQNITSEIEANAEFTETYWNDTTQTLVTHYGHKKLNHGEELWTPLVLNNSSSDIFNGEPIYIVSSSGSYPTVSRASSSTYKESRLIGVATEDILIGQLGRATRFGYVNDIDLSYMNAGDEVYLSSTGTYTNVVPTGSEFIVSIGKVVKNTANGSLFVHIRSSENSAELTNQNGWSESDFTKVTTTLTNATRTLTLAPTSGNSDYHYYHNGVKYIKTGDTFQWTNVNGTHLIYYNGSTIEEIINPTNLQFRYVKENMAGITTIYWSTILNAYIYANNEKQSIFMSNKTRASLFEYHGCKVIEGLKITNLTTNGTGNLLTDVQFGSESGTIINETIITSIPSVLLTEGYTVFYKTGDTMWLAMPSTLSQVSVLTGGTGRIAYNPYSGSTWTLDEAPNGYFVLMHYFVSNTLGNKIGAVVGEHTYNTIGEARAAAQSEIKSLFTTGIPIKEFAPLWTIVYETKNTFTNSVKGRIVPASTEEDYILWIDETDTVSVAGFGQTTTSFLGLLDTPSAYNGYNSALVTVSSDGTGLIFENRSGITLTSFNNNLTQADIPNAIDNSYYRITNGVQNIIGQKTFTSQALVPYVVYSSGWTNNYEVPTKAAIYEKFVSIDNVYIHKSGDTISGNLNISGNTVLSAISGTTLSLTGQLSSTVTTGTSPLIISSTTLVNNLNVQYLNGLTSSAFSLSGHTHTISEISGLTTALTNKQDVLNGIGIVRSNNGSITYSTDNDVSYNGGISKWISGRTYLLGEVVIDSDGDIWQALAGNTNDNPQLLTSSNWGYPGLFSWTKGSNNQVILKNGNGWFDYAWTTLNSSNLSNDSDILKISTVATNISAKSFSGLTTHSNGILANTITVTGDVITNGSYKYNTTDILRSDGTNLFVSVPSSGYLYFRPNGSTSTSGQTSIGNNVLSTGNLQSSSHLLGGYMGLIPYSASGYRKLYLSPNGGDYNTYLQIAPAGTGTTSQIDISNYGSQSNYNSLRLRVVNDNSFIENATTGTGSTTITGLTINLKTTIDNDLTVTGVLTSPSDRRLKSDIKQIESASDKVLNLNPVSYIKDGKKSFGFIAQELKEIYPEFVFGEENEDSYLSVNYQHMIAVLTKTIQEQNELIKKLAERITNIENNNKNFS